MGRGAENPKNAAKTTPDDDDMFEAQERTIGGANRARRAPKQAKLDHAWHDFVDLPNKCLCLGCYSYTRDSRPVECVGNLLRPGYAQRMLVAVTDPVQ